MTQVLVDSQRFTDGDRAQSRGTVICEPYSLVIDSGAFVIPAEFIVAYPGEAVTITLDELPTGNAWKVRLEVDGLVIERLVYPTGAGPVNLADLADLDPETLLPVPTPSPAWEAYTDGVIATEAATRLAEDTDLGARIDGKVPATRTVNGHPLSADVVVTKSDVGLGSVDDVSAANLRDRSTHTGTQTSATIVDFTEAAQDAIGALLAGASGISLSYDDAANTLTVTGAGDTSALAEQMRDAIGVALIGAGLITVAVNDAADTITLSTSATANSTDAALRDRSTHTGTQLADTIVETALVKMLTAAERTQIAANTTAITLKVDKSANLSDIAGPAIARENLSLGDYTKLRPFFADLANRRNKRVDIACFGDSTFEGYGLTSWDYTLSAQLAATLRAQYGVTTGARGLVPIENDLTNQPFWPHVYTGGTITNVGYGVNMKQIGLLGAGQKFVHTVATPLTSFYIHYAIFSTGTFYYKIDGGSAVNVIANGTGTIVPTRLLVSAAVTSTIEVGWVSGSAYIDGIQENKNDETSGIQVHNLGYSGSSANSWVGQTASRSWPVCAAVLQPSLMVVELGANDGRIAALNRTAAQFQADLTTLLGTLETLVSTTAPILVSMTYSVGDSLLREPWANYIAAAAAVCAADSRAVLVNHSARMYASNTTDTLALYNAAAPPHATAKGYALMAETLVASLTPR